MEIGSGAGGPNNHRLALLSECDSALGGLPLHVDILCLHEGLFFVDISRLDFIIERTGSVLAGNSGKRLSLVAVDSSLTVGLTESFGNLTRFSG